MSSLASVVPTRACPTDSGDTDNDPSKDCYTYTSYGFPASFTPPSQCCDTCSIQASRVHLNIWASDPSPTAAPKSPYTLVSDGFTFTSPSVYVVYSGLYAQAECTLYGSGQIGNNISITTIAYPPEALSTAKCYQEGDGGFRGWQTIDYDNWLNPEANSVVATESGCRLFGTQPLSDPGGTDLVASPEFSLPQNIATLEPVWGQFGCKPWRYGAFDPPRVLTRADAMAPDPGHSSTQASSATPAAHLTSPLVTPTAGNVVPSVTASPDSEDPKDIDPDPSTGLAPVSQTQDPNQTPMVQIPKVTSENAQPSISDPQSDLAPVPNDPEPDPTPMSHTASAAGGDPPAISKIADADTTANPSANSNNQPPPMKSWPDTTKPNQNPGPGSVNDPTENHPSTLQALPDPVLSVDSATYEYHIDSASNIIIASQTAFPGGPGISLSNIQISLASSANSILVDGTHLPIEAPAATAYPSFTFGGDLIGVNSESQYVVQGQTLIPGASALTISGTPISLAPSASHVVFGSDTIALASPAPSGPLPFTVGTQIFTANAASQFVAGSQTLVPGAPAITISGTPVSLASSATQVIVGGSTIPILSTISPNPPTAIVNGQTITANSASEFILGGQTIVPGAPAITISGTPYSFPSEPHLSIMVGSKAVPLTVDASGDIVVGSNTLRAGGAPATVSGETFSEDAGSSDLIIASGTSTKTERLGQIINGALGRTAAPSNGAKASATNANLNTTAFTGAASGRAGNWVLTGKTVLIGLSCISLIQI